MPGDVTYVGIDLGTFKTSIVCSNGNRSVIPSAVGWARDLVAQRTFGSVPVLGELLTQHRRALNVIRPFAKGAFKYLPHRSAGIRDEQLEIHQQAAALLVQHAVASVKPAEGTRVVGAVGVPSRASLESKQFVLQAVHAAFHAAIVVYEPFAVAYGMNRLTNALIVDIGAGTIDICPMYGSYPSEQDQVTLQLGGDWIDEVICAAALSQFPAIEWSLETARQLKEKFGTARQPGERALVTRQVHGQAQQFDLTDIVHAACRRFVAPIAEGIGAVLARFEDAYHQVFLSNILLAGGGSQLAGLDFALEEALRPMGAVSVTRVYDSVFAGALGALRLAMDLPSDQWSQFSGTSSSASKAAA